MGETFPESMPSHEILPVVAMGWKGTKNGPLLRRAGESGFEVLITSDENMPYPQNTRGRSLALVVLDIQPDTILTQTACVPAIEALLVTAEPGGVYLIEGPHPKRDRGWRRSFAPRRTKGINSPLRCDSPSNSTPSATPSPRTTSAPFASSRRSGWSTSRGRATTAAGTPEEGKAILDDLGLKASGSHVGLDRLQHHLDEVIAEHKTMGHPLRHRSLPRRGRPARLHEARGAPHAHRHEGQGARPDAVLPQPRLRVPAAQR